MGKVARQTEALMVNVYRSCKSRGCGMKDLCLTSGDPTHILKGMVEKGLERESDDVIVCDLKVVTLIAEMLLLLSRSIPIGKRLWYGTRDRLLNLKFRK